ncbi:hypothetical protein [Polaromonas sp. P5_D5]
MALEDAYIKARFFSIDRFLLNQTPDLQRFLKVVQPVRLDPPFCGFHQEFRVVILVGKKRVERHADVFAFLFDFVFANIDYFLFQMGTQLASSRLRRHLERQSKIVMNMLLVVDVMN